MTDLLRGNYKVKVKTAPERSESVTQEFERRLKKVVGGSITTVLKGKKFVYDPSESK